MPTYEYACKNCGETIEVFQSFSDKPLKKHKQCGGELKKVFHARGIVFKGDGFYATDSKPPKTSKTPSETPADKKSKSTTDKKPTETAAAASTKSASTDTD